MISEGNNRDKAVDNLDIMGIGLDLNCYLGLIIGDGNCTRVDLGLSVLFTRKNTRPALLGDSFLHTSSIAVEYKR